MENNQSTFPRATVSLVLYLLITDQSNTCYWKGRHRFEVRIDECPDWQCPACTCSNVEQAVKCGMCMKNRPEVESEIHAKHCSWRMVSGTPPLDPVHDCVFHVLIRPIQVIGLVPREWKPNNSKMNGDCIGKEGWGYIGGKD